jgi:hypothetical protein
VKRKDFNKAGEDARKLVTIDGEWLRNEVKDAVKQYFAPVTFACNKCRSFFSRD